MKRLPGMKAELYNHEHLCYSLSIIACASYPKGHSPITRSFLLQYKLELLEWEIEVEKRHCDTEDDGHQSKNHFTGKKGPN